MSSHSNEDEGYFPPITNLQMQVEIHHALSKEMFASKKFLNTANISAGERTALLVGGPVEDVAMSPLGNEWEMNGEGEMGVEAEEEEVGEEEEEKEEKGEGNKMHIKAISQPREKLRLVFPPGLANRGYGEDSSSMARQPSYDKEEYALEVTKHTLMCMEMRGVFALNDAVQRWRAVARVPSGCCSNASKEAHKLRTEVAALKGQLEEVRTAQAGTQACQQEQKSEGLFGASIWSSLQDDHLGLLKDSLREAQAGKKELVKQNKLLEDKLSSYREVNLEMTGQCVALRRKQQELWNENSELKMRQLITQEEDVAAREERLDRRRVGGACGAMVLVGVWVWLVIFSGY